MLQGVPDETASTKELMEAATATADARYSTSRPIEPIFFNLSLVFKYTSIVNERKRSEIFIRSRTSIFGKCRGGVSISLRRKDEYMTLEMAAHTRPPLFFLHQIMRVEYKILLPCSIGEIENTETVNLRGKRHLYSRIMDCLSYVEARTGVVTFLLDDAIFINGDSDEAERGRKETLDELSRIFPLPNLAEFEHGRVIFVGGEGSSANACAVASIPRGHAHSPLHMDEGKLILLVSLYRERLTNILISNNSYLLINEFAVKLFSDGIFSAEKCREQVTELYLSIGRIQYDIAPTPCQAVSVQCRGSSYISIADRVLGCSCIIACIEDMGKILPRATDCHSLVEVETEMAEFVCGRKMGKTNKIAKITGCNLRIVGMGDNTMAAPSPWKNTDHENCTTSALLETSSAKQRAANDPSVKQTRFLITGATQQVVEFLKLLKMELPTSMTFFVDRKYHRQIIGVRGKTIQAIMKKYDVYIKLMNEEKGCDSSPNVIMQTPLKNQKNLEKMRAEILLMATGLASQALVEKHVSLFESISDDLNVVSSTIAYNYNVVRYRDANGEIKLFDSPSTAAGDATEQETDVFPRSTDWRWGEFAQQHGNEAEESNLLGMPAAQVDDTAKPKHTSTLNVSDREEQLMRRFPLLANLMSIVAKRKEPKH